MSKIASWAYKNEATIYPFLGQDNWSHKANYGKPYLVNCTWKAESKLMTDDNGDQFVARHSFFTEFHYEGEQVRVAASGDYIARGNTRAQRDPINAGAAKIMTVKENDMSWANELPDYEVVT